jgi:hypothetical protein
MFPTDAKLLNRAREKLVRLAKLEGVGLRQSYARVAVHSDLAYGPVEVLVAKPCVLNRVSDATAQCHRGPPLPSGVASPMWTCD